MVEFPLYPQNLYYLCTTMKLRFDKYKDFIGLGALCVGVLLLVISFLFGWTTHNWVLGICLLLIIGGVIGYVISMKQQSKY